jgi:hypothetical protein
MPGVVYVIAPLLCPIAMGVMMWLMMRPKKDAAPPVSSEVAQLHSELDELRRSQIGSSPHLSR